MAAGNFVGVNHMFFEKYVRNLVRSSRQVRAIEKGVGLESAVGAAVEDEIHMMRHQGAVFFYTGFDLDDRGVARIAGGEFFLVIHHQLYRPSGFFGQEINHGEIHEIALAAEIAADINGIKVEFFLRQLERVGDLLAHAVGHFAARPELRRAVGRRADDAGMRLDVTLMHHRRGKSVLDDDVRLAKAGLEIAFAPGDIDKIVGRLLQRLGQPLVVHDIGMKKFRARLERFHRVEQRLGFFVFDFDEIQRLFGDNFAVRRHRRNFFADETHFAVGQDRHVVKSPADFQARSNLRR